MVAQTISPREIEIFAFVCPSLFYPLINIALIVPIFNNEIIKRFVESSTTCSNENEKCPRKLIVSSLW